MANRFAPKPTILTGEPTPTALEAWINNLTFNLVVDGNFDEFLEEGFQWSPPSVVNRGLVDDEGDGPRKRNAKTKAAYLNLMLGSIHSYAPVISKRYITEEARSLDEIWDRLRTRFGCRKTGALILELTSLTREPDETHEGLWERMLSFVESNLLSVQDKIQHLGSNIVNSETMTPTLMNICIVLWLRIIHPELPSLVKQKYATDLRNKTLASIRDEISESLNSLLSELTNKEEVNISRLYKSRNQKFNRKQAPNKSVRNKSRSCIICHTAKRPAEHFLSECPFLPDEDRHYLKSRTRLVEASEDEEEESENEEIESCNRRIDIETSPEIHVLCKNQPVSLVLDSGAESNLIAERCAKRLNAKVHHTKTCASQADGMSKLKVIGEVHIEFERFPHTFKFNGLVIKDLKDDVVAGTPFLKLNDIYVRPAKRTIYIGDEEVIKYKPARSIQSTNREVAAILRVPHQTVLLPGEVVNFDIPDKLQGQTQIAIEPRMISPSLMNNKISESWLQPQIVSPTDNILSICNPTEQPVLLKKHEQIANVRSIVTPEENPHTSQEVPIRLTTPVKSTPNLAYKTINVDPNNQVSNDIKTQFQATHEEYGEVFDDSSLGLYNGHSGNLEVKVNMGPMQPPQRKGRMPLYNRKLQDEYQEICDSLEGTVLVKPEEAGITVEYLNPSFLIRKPSGKKRLVTAFGEVGKYTKPQPALMPDINQILRQVANWNWVIKTDLTSAYWQMPLAKDSMKYCGIVTPFKGIRAYARGAMGMPGTETALEELLSRILGHLVSSGGVAKIADDLMVGGDTPENVLEIWRQVLDALKQNGLKLSATKTICLPESMMILGWIWRKGKLSASPHKVSVLKAVEPPSTVGKLRSYVGSYKFLSRVIPHYSDVLSPLEEVIAGCNSNEKITWTDSLLNAFKYSQKQLTNTKVITLPRKSDHLQIITDASKTGIGATLYVIRRGKPLIAGFFNARLKKHQIDWMPCEIEALSIGASATHFAPDIVNNSNQAIILTDSRPCVLAYEKLCRGEFSSSSRVSTFLSILSRYQIKLIHIKGSENILSDYTSRNSLECNNPNCQVCKFIEELEESVVRQCSVTDILNSGNAVPFSSRKTWLEMQQSCKDLRRTTAHLHQGTTPSKKETDIKDVKRYLQTVKIGKDGLLVVYKQDPLNILRERIVVPRIYLHGLLVSLHLKLQHPSRAQLKKVFQRAFYALDSDKAVDEINEGCHTCKSLQNMPSTFLEQSTTCPASVGSNYSSDVIKRSGQLILALRENISSFTTAKFIKDETASSLSEGLQVLLSQFRSNSGSSVVVRVDSASGWRSLVLQNSLTSIGIILELGHEKYKNKNAIVDRAISELHAEINRIDENGGKISELVLSKAVANINDRIRDSGLSSREIYTKRDQYTGKQLPVDDAKLISEKHENRIKSHIYSSKYASRGKSQPICQNIAIGDIVYINSDRIKTKPRDKYIVVKSSYNHNRKNTVCLQKFVGNQLRSRVYVVNSGDILKIPPRISVSKYENASSDEEDINIPFSCPKLHNEDEVPDQRPPTESKYKEKAPPSLEINNVEEGSTNPGPRRSARTRNPPAYFGDYVMGK